MLLAVRFPTWSRRFELTRTNVQFSPRHPNSAKAMANWERKSSYLLREIVKFRTYIDGLTAAQALKEKIYAERREAEAATAAADSNTSAKGEVADAAAATASASAATAEAEAAAKHEASLTADPTPPATTSQEQAKEVETTA